MPAEQAQRTEQPTPRRKQKAREEGQVPSSREFTAAVQFAATVLLLVVFAGEVGEGLTRSIRGIVREAFRVSLDAERFYVLSATLLQGPLSFVWALGAVLIGVSLLSHLAQTGFALVPKRLAPDFTRLNPMSRIREIPSENLSQTFRALLLLPLAGWVFWYVVDTRVESFLRLPKQGVEAGAAVVGEALLDLLLQAAAVLLLLGAVDLYRQRRKLHKKLLMTKQEIRQEQKDLEGNPQIKARLRRLQREMRRRQMIRSVPEATVVITNPQHYAVALKYDAETMPAPLVLAKGLDYLALRIRAIAEEHRIPIVENPPLAQVLYRSCQAGSEIPPHLYRAVAEILAYIYRLTRPRG
jgi:flagellar biosynthetic protein FlhB